MTITYTGSVANARLFGFSRLLFYWRGSIYKLMYKEMVIFCVIYSILSLMYRLALNERQKMLFENIALYCDAFTNLIPLSFVLGFYVSVVVTRWWNQYMCIPWPDRMMMYVTTMIDGADERSKMIRRTIMRYLSLSSLIVFQATSVVVKKRFPTMEHLMDAGLITEGEVNAMNEVQTPHGKWWVPFVWICNLIKAARKEGKIADTYLMKTLIDEVQSYRGNLGMLFSYDWISIPLVYTQVTTLAVYTFFLSCVFGRQFLDPEKKYPGHEVDLYVPSFTLLQFFFYMGWLKVAEQLINPFGEDDDDFEINWVIDRNLQVSLIVVDDMFGSYPQLGKDSFFDESAPDYLPYTKSTIDTISRPHMGSTADLSVSYEGMKIVTPMDTIQENDQSTNHVNNVNHATHYPAYHHTPYSSPANNRRLFPNMIIGSYAANGMHTPLNASKCTLDGKVDAKPSYPGSLTKHGAYRCSSGKLHCQLDKSGQLDLAAVVQHQLSPSTHTAPCSPMVKCREVTSLLDVPSVVCMLPKPDSHADHTAVSTSAPTCDVSISITPDEDESPVEECEVAEEEDARVAVPSSSVPQESDPSEAGQENRFDVHAVADDQYRHNSDATALTHALTTISETERNRHSSDEQSVDYNHSNNSSVNSFTPLLKAASMVGKKEP